MNFKDYQTEAHKTAIYPYLASPVTTPIEISNFDLSCEDDMAIQYKVVSYSFPVSFIYPSIGLAGEVGEVSEIIKKIIRDNDGKETEKDVENISKELGDVLWYVAELCTCFNLDLQKVAEANVAKLKKRQEENKLHGSGDNR